MVVDRTNNFRGSSCDSGLVLDLVLVRRNCKSKKPSAIQNKSKRPSEQPFGGSNKTWASQVVSGE